jgi:hypothetical protein
MARRQDHHCRPRWIHAIHQPKGNPQQGGKITHTTSEREGNATAISENQAKSNDEVARPPLLSSLDPHHL